MIVEQYGNGSWLTTQFYCLARNGRNQATIDIIVADIPSTTWEWTLEHLSWGIIYYFKPRTTSGIIWQHVSQTFGITEISLN